MTVAKSKRILWYTRREGVVRGPYPANQISRYILLGRIRDSDEVRREAGDWEALAEHAELIPDVMKLPPSEENHQKLLMARMREDERSPGDRRERNPRPPAHVVERRSGRERRQPETSEAIRHRALKYEVSHVAHTDNRLYRYPVLLSVLVVFGFLLSFVVERGEPLDAAVDCTAAPSPGVNWEHCNLVGMVAGSAELVGAHMSNARLDTAQLPGANLRDVGMEYASLNQSNLQQADLSHARLVGAALRGADLRKAAMVDADLSYANLSGAHIEGADFSGAILDHAIWVDQHACAPGSVGVCR